MGLTTSVGTAGTLLRAATMERRLANMMMVFMIAVMEYLFDSVDWLLVALVTFAASDVDCFRSLQCR